GREFDIHGDGNLVPVYYNGFRAGVHIKGPTDSKDAGTTNIAELLSTSRASALGIEPMAKSAIQGRAVLIDLEAHFGKGRTVVNNEMLADVIEKQNVVIEPGDMLCLHTGFAQRILEM